MTDSPEQQQPQKSEAGEVPFDAANQSLADALRASFRILKVIMFLLVIVFLCSGVKIIDNSEEAVILRFGALELKDARPYSPGLLLAFPYPVDEPLIVPTKQRNTLKIMSHWFHLREGDATKSLSELAGLYGGGLDPAKDGALLTADDGLVHVKWTLIYRIRDLERYVRNVADTVVGDVETLITSVLESAAIRIVANYTAEEVTRKKTAEMAAEVMGEVNAALDRLGTGIRVESLEPETTVPMDTLGAFADVTKAENEKAFRIQEARKQANETLTGAAGDAHEDLVNMLEQLEAACAAGDEAAVAELEARIDEALELRVSGEAGSMVSAAKSYYTEAVQKIEGDVEGYRAVLDEYLRSPDLLINRLWEQAKQKILSRSGVTKVVLPTDTGEVRIYIGPDPKQKAIDEIEQIKKQTKESARLRGE